MRKICRAIILAAGRGTRLRPYTNKTPKPLLPVKGKPIIEYAIEALLARGIHDITIITGYRSNQFRYLKKKYGALIRRNRYFNRGSNLLSLKLAIDKLSDCIILDGDVIIKPEAILTHVDYSGYMYVHEERACEWAILSKNGIIEKVIADLTEKTDFDALHSISYWIDWQAALYRNKLMRAEDNVNYVDDIAIQIPMLRAYELKKGDFIEIDTVEDYENANKD